MSALVQRARDVSLASVLASYPDAEVEATLRGLPAFSSHAVAGPLVSSALRADLDSARAAYTRLFDAGGARASLYETEYGRMRGMSKGVDLADIAGFYLAFGLELDVESAHELVDHIAVELEFYALLLLKEAALSEAGDESGVSVVHDARVRFLADHLGRFGAAIASRPGVDESELYGPVFRFIAELVRKECEALHVQPAPLDFFADREADEMKCGSVHLPVVPD